MDEHLDTIRDAADEWRRAQEGLVVARERLVAALRQAHQAGLRTDLMQQESGLTRPTFYRLLGGVRN